MSRYDYADPGTDPAYCNGISGRRSDGPKDMWRVCSQCGDGFLYRFTTNYQIRPVCGPCQLEHSTQSVVVAVADYRQTRQQEK